MIRSRAWPALGVSVWVLAGCSGGAVSGPVDTGANGVAALRGEDELLDALRVDRDAALQRYSEGPFEPDVSGGGWPVPVVGGWLFVDPNQTGALAGGFNDWIPEDMVEDAGFSYLVRAADRGDSYKFTDGADDWHADPWARALTWDGNGEMSLLHPVDAHVEHLYSASGAGLAERDLHVWVPAADAAIDRVLYAHDGQNLFDPTAMWGGWHLDDALLGLGAAGETTLVVGIFNTNDRMEEYTHVEDTLDGDPYGGWGDAYGDFVQEQVRPLVAGSYFPGAAEPTITGLLGSSLGGLISFHIADRYPGEYSFAASMSGTMGWGSIELHNQTLIERYAAHGHQATVLYLDSGGSGDCVDSDGDGINDDDPRGEDNYCENMQLRDTLVGAGYAFDADLYHWYEPGASHDEQAWAARVAQPLAIFAGL
ncbi:MAG: hypothetical protein EXR69_08265 [Myxococcales bacterium]|nr:hypothetical protein [Myxococcales bacterium]